MTVVDRCHFLEDQAGGAQNPALAASSTVIGTPRFVNSLNPEIGLALSSERTTSKWAL